VTSSPKISPHAENGLLLDDQRGAFVAARDEHEHQVRGLRVERDVADRIDDQQRDPLQPVEFGVLGFGRLADVRAGRADAARCLPR
jgi:hypothetical protein